MTKQSILLGAGLLGNGLGQPRRRGWLLNDTFTTDRAAGAINGTAAEPGPGTRVATDTNAKLSLSGGSALFATGGVTSGDPGLWYGAQTRLAGRLLVAEAQHTTQGVYIGWDSNQATTPISAVALNGTTLIARVASNVTVGSVTPGVTYPVAVALRSQGAFYFIKVSGSWVLLYISANSATTPMFPSISCLSASSVFTANYLRVPVVRWLPVPLLSDGFSTFATSAPTATNGLGHAEGIAGGLGAGGGGLWPYVQVGTWQASGGVASASALSGGVALAYMDVEALDLIATVKVTRGAGVAGVVVRGDAANHVRAVHDGTNAQLIKRVAGVDTTLIDAVATYVAGAEIRVIVASNAFRLFYNDVAIGSEQAIADGALNTDGYAGLYTTSTGNTFDDLVVYARGTGGEYVALDAF